VGQDFLTINSVENEKEEKNIENKNIIQTPQESRQHFIKSKIHKK
jgi:hypothetical protein